MNESSNQIFQAFCDSTQMTFFLNISAILLIFVFILNPFNFTGYKKYIGKSFIILILGYSLYISIIASYSLFSIKDVLENVSLGTVRYNLFLNFIFCVCLFLFMAYIIKNIFD